MELAEQFAHTLGAARRVFAQTLTEIYPPSEAETISWMVLEHVLNAPKVKLLSLSESALSATQLQHVQHLLARLLQHEPVQYVLGKAHFYGHEFKVAQGVLIPRPETEELVSLIVKAEQHNQDLIIADIGTGSGCIAISLALALKAQQVYGVDISEQALNIATVNAQNLNAHVSFIEHDILSETWPEALDNLDIIVSNPPYVLQHEADTMKENVLNYEPHTALFVPDNNPLLFYNAIAKFGVQTLKKEGRIYFETHYLHAGAVATLLSNYSYKKIQVVLDMFDKPRFVAACLD